MELETIIKHRRNIKPQFFSPDVIPDHEIEDVLESANWAPTHGLPNHGDLLFLQVPLDKILLLFNLILISQKFCLNLLIKLNMINF